MPRQRGVVVDIEVNVSRERYAGVACDGLNQRDVTKLPRHARNEVVFTLIPLVFISGLDLPLSSCKMASLSACSACTEMSSTRDRPPNLKIALKSLRRHLT